MALTRDDVMHVAQLARLELSEEEITRFQGDLSAVLEYIAELKELDLADVEPTAQVTGLTNRLRTDEPRLADPDERQRLLDSFPDRDGDQLKVKQVFE